MTEGEKSVALMGGGAAVALVIAWLFLRAPAEVVPGETPQGGQTTYSPSSFTFPPLPPSAALPSPGDLNMPINIGSISIPPYGAAPVGTTPGGCGCGCGSNSATQTYAGDDGAQAAVLGPLMNYLVGFLPRGIVAAPAFRQHYGGATDFQTMMNVWKANNDVFAKAADVSFSTTLG